MPVEKGMLKQETRRVPQQRLRVLAILRQFARRAQSRANLLRGFSRRDRTRTKRTEEVSDPVNDVVTDRPERKCCNFENADGNRPMNSVWRCQAGRSNNLSMN